MHSQFGDLCVRRCLLVIQHCEFELRRSFDVFQNEEELAPIKDAYDAAKKKGEAWTQNRSFLGPEMAEQVTSIKNAVGAFSVPAASFWPYKLTTSLLAILVSRYPENLNVQTNTPVTRLSTSSNTENSIQTPRGTLSAGKVVLATNAYTPGLLPSFTNTITPVKGMACHIHPQEAVHPHLNNTYNIHYPLGVDYLNPRPDGGIVVGGGSWLFRHDSASWKGNFDDSTRFPASVEKYWREEYMQKTFLGWGDSGARPDYIWVGIQGYTENGLPHVGRVPGVDGQWMLAGFNGGGMALIGTAARAVAKMVVGDLGFGDVRDEFGLLRGMATGVGRMKSG